MDKKYVVTFTNADSEITTRGFNTERELRGYILALSEQGIDFEITVNLGKGFTDWAKGVVNA